VAPSDSVDDARVESDWSSELSTELKPSRTLASNSGSFGSNLRMGTWGFEFWKGSTRGFYPYINIYILIGFEYILFFIIILILKLKIIFRKKTEIVF
jgi:hypothetical protein